MFGSESTPEKITNHSVPKTTVFGTLPVLLQNVYRRSYFYSEPLYVVVGLGLGPEQSPLYKTGEGIFIRDLGWRFLRRPFPGGSVNRVE